MAKLSREELLNKIDSLSITDDEKISLMEDISDSFVSDTTDELNSVKADLEKALSDVEDLKAKYKARFLSGEVMVEDNKEETSEEVVDPEMKEEEVIDVEDIFTDSEEEKKEEEDED